MTQSDGGKTWLPWRGAYTIPSLPNGASFPILLRGTVSQSASGNIVNAATTVSPAIDPNPSNNTSTGITTVTPPPPPSADISLVKSADKSPVKRGEVLTYSLAASNKGPDAAKDVTIEDSLSPSLTGGEYSADGGATWQPWPGTYKVPSLAAGGSFSILVRGTVSQSASGVVANTAVISSPTGDPNPGDNNTTTLTPIDDSADLSVVKKGDKSPVLPGEVLTYQITAANKGPEAAKDVTITDIVPDSLNNPEYSTDGGKTWRAWSGVYALGVLNAGGSASILVRGSVSRRASGVIANTATVGSSSADPNPGDNSSTEHTPVDNSTDISVTKTADKASVNQGDRLVYTITATNNGPNIAPNVTLTDAIPEELLGAEYSPDGGSAWLPWNGSLDIGTMRRGGSVSVLIRGTAGRSNSGFVENSASVTTSAPDTNPGNNSASVTTPISRPAAPPPAPGKADLSIVKTVCTSERCGGHTCGACNACGGRTCGGQTEVTYTLKVTNHGPDAADGVTVTDELPKELSGGAYSLDGGITWAQWKGSLGLGALPVNSTVTILIKAKVNGCAPQIIKNAAKVSSAAKDENPENNASEAAFRAGGRNSGAFSLPPLALGRKCARNR